uniref:HTH_48 domain-containing protein n=1 Tax=Heterorhabditis bacteriophora TaxID=37862 RepID=A0A1I7WB53_HETBA
MRRIYAENDHFETLRDFECVISTVENSVIKNLVNSMLERIFQITVRHISYFVFVINTYSNKVCYHFETMKKISIKAVIFHEEETKTKLDTSEDCGTFKKLNYYLPTQFICNFKFSLIISMTNFSKVIILALKNPTKTADLFDTTIKNMVVIAGNCDRDERAAEPCSITHLQLQLFAKVMTAENITNNVILITNYDVLGGCISFSLLFQRFVLALYHKSRFNGKLNLIKQFENDEAPKTAYSTLYSLRVPTTRSGTEACKSIPSVLGEGVVSHSTCKYWFQCFKVGDFDVNDRQRSGTLRTPKTD